MGYKVVGLLVLKHGNVTIVEAWKARGSSRAVASEWWGRMASPAKIWGKG